jgi:hypothetical protein
VSEDIRCDGCPKLLQGDEALICLDDHSARLEPTAPPYVFCASCMAAHLVAWNLMAEGNHGRSEHGH